MKRSFGLTICLLILAGACSDGKSQFKSGTATGTAPATAIGPNPPGGLDTISSASNPAVSEAPKTVEVPAPPAPTKVIKKGSFSVYTVPADPLPLKPYDIIITVDLSTAEDLEGYKQDDLSGSITGTDNFVYGIGSKIDGIEAFSFDAQKNQAILKITIPGAINNTKDVIKVNSTLLNESQTVELVF